MATEPPITTGDGGMIARIKALLLAPTGEWTRIAAEPMTPMGIMTKWVVPLAAIGPLAGLARDLAMGASLNGIPVESPPAYLAANFAMTWAFAILNTYLLALIVDALAPSFGGRKDPIAALKVAAYGSLAFFLSGIFLAHPMIQLGGVLGLYSAYLIYVGLPLLMRSDREKAIVYAAVAVVALAVLVSVAGWITGTVTETLLPPVPYGFDFRP